MSGNNPISFRFPFESQISKLHPDVQQVHRTTWNAITDLQGAIPHLKEQIDATKTAVATATAAVRTSTASQTIVTMASTIGTVNDQSGFTAYTTQQSDYGAFIILNDASPIAVTLTVLPGVQLPWYAIFLNFGAGAATLTPSTGVISYPGNLAAASMPLSGANVASVVFDGTNFSAYSIPISPANTPAIAHEFFTAYNAGVFTQAQPSFADISGATGLANRVVATPDGSPGVVAIRALVAADLPGGFGTGTVTSVALTVPSHQTVAGSPVTTSGTLAVTDNTQSANLVFAGPPTGPPATPTFRAIAEADLPASSQIGVFGLTADGGSAVPATGIKGFVTVPYNCTITGWTIIADQAGSASADVWFTAGSAPPVAPSIPNSGSKISASAPIALSSAQSAAGGATEISTWTLPMTQWGTLAFNLASVTTCTRLAIQIQVTRS